MFSLQLNENKAEVIIFVPPSSVTSLSNVPGGFLDTSFNFKCVVKGSFYQLGTIAKLKLFLSYKDLETPINAVITSTLDYCNSLHMGLTHSVLARLQMVQNAAARL